MSLWKLLGAPHRWYGSMIEGAVDSHQKWMLEQADIERRRWKSAIKRRLPLELLIQERIAIPELICLVCDYLKYEMSIWSPVCIQFYTLKASFIPFVKGCPCCETGTRVYLYTFLEKP